MALLGALAPGESLTGAAAAHRDGCPSCQAAGVSLARLDLLLGAEPAPLAPLGLTGAILRAVARQRAADAAWLRRRLALALTGAAAAALLLGWLGPVQLDPLGLGSWQPEAWLPDPTESLAWRDPLGTLLSAFGDATAPLAPLLGAGPPLMALLLLGPALLLLNWTLSRGPLARPGVAV